MSETDTYSDERVRALLSQVAWPRAIACAKVDAVVSTTIALSLFVLLAARRRPDWVTALAAAYSVLALWRAMVAFRAKPKTPEQFTPAEVDRARARLHPCPRCQQPVHSAQWRCGSCGSARHQLVVWRGIDVWMPALVLSAVVFCFVVLLFWG